MKITKNELKSLIQEVLREEICSKEIQLKEAGFGTGAVKAYLTYLCYDGMPEYVYGLTTSKVDAQTEYKEKHLPQLLEGWPDDITSLFLQEVILTKSEYKIISKCIGTEISYGSKVYSILKGFYERTKSTSNDREILELDGLYTNYDICSFMVKTGTCSSELSAVGVSLDDFDPEDDYNDELLSVLMDNPDIHKKAIQAYIDKYY